MKEQQETILVTGGAGFIGSHIVEKLLSHPRVQKVIVLDNLSSGSLKNLSGCIANPKLEFREGDIRDDKTCREACKDVTLVCHQAAMGSVPRSIENPVLFNEVNIKGTLSVFNAARESGIKKIVYASSSSVYGDDGHLPKREERIGKPLSPYALTKQVNELYAGLYNTVYGMHFIGLRYFNVFGPRQNPAGPYAAAIPLFINKLLKNQSPVIYGDGTQTRDFTYVDNVVQANVIAIFSENENAWNQVFNIAGGERTSVSELFNILRKLATSTLVPEYKPARPGEITHSYADISKARNLLGYIPEVDFREGLGLALEEFRSIN